MIGRFASGLGDRPLAPVAAGAILFAIGVWNGAEPLLAAYPGERALVAVEGASYDAIEVVRKRGAVVRFLTGPSLEMQAVLEPGEVVVLYRDDMPRYGAVKQAVAEGPATYGLWPDAPAEEDRRRIWSLENRTGVVVSREETVAGLRDARRAAAMLPALIAVVGLGLVLVGLRRWRAWGAAR